MTIDPLNIPRFLGSNTNKNTEKDNPLLLSGGSQCSNPRTNCHNWVSDGGGPSHMWYHCSWCGKTAVDHDGIFRADVKRE